MTAVNGVVLVGDTEKVKSERRLEGSLERDGPGGEGQGARGLHGAVGLSWQQPQDAAPSG